MHNASATAPWHQLNATSSPAATRCPPLKALSRKSSLPSTKRLFWAKLHQPMLREGHNLIQKTEPLSPLRRPLPRITVAITPQLCCPAAQSEAALLQRFTRATTGRSTCAIIYSKRCQPTARAVRPPNCPAPSQRGPPQWAPTHAAPARGAPSECIPPPDIWPPNSPPHNIHT